MMVPVNEIPPIPEDVRNEVDEFRKKFLENVGVNDET